MSNWLSIMGGYVLLLCALVIVTLRREEPMRRTALVLAADMIAGYAYSFAVGTGWDYSLWMIAVNALACVIITRHPAGRWQAIIGWSFILQIGTDVGRIASDLNSGSTDLNFVYWSTSVLAFAQLFLLGGWAIDERLGYPSRLGAHLPAGKARHQGVAKCP